MRFECNDILIRDFTINDVNDLYIVLSDKEVMKHIEKPFGLLETRTFVEKYGLITNPLIYAIYFLPDKKVIGHCIYHIYNEDAYELGWVINKDYWGKGIAGNITVNMIKYSKNKGIKKLVIECDKNQKATRKLAEKFNFVLIESIKNINIYERVL